MLFSKEGTDLGWGLLHGRRGESPLCCGVMGWGEGPGRAQTEPAEPFLGVWDDALGERAGAATLVPPSWVVLGEGQMWGSGWICGFGEPPAPGGLFGGADSQG